VHNVVNFGGYTAILFRLLNVPNNGAISCTRSGFVVGGICTISCDDGFELVGSDSRTYLCNQTWSGTDACCLPGMFYYNMSR